MKFIVPLFVILFACSSPDSKNDGVLEPEAFKAKIENGATLIDVRTQEEYTTGHIPGSLNFDIKNPGFKNNVMMLDPKKEYAVYCASGVRSAKAAELMKENGFTSVFTLTDGIKTWKEKGLPLE
jgi:rhodanese-related sulfurtransferase